MKIILQTFAFFVALVLFNHPAMAQERVTEPFLLEWRVKLKSPTDAHVIQESVFYTPEIVKDFTFMRYEDEHTQIDTQTSKRMTFDLESIVVEYNRSSAITVSYGVLAKNQLELNRDGVVKKITFLHACHHHQLETTVLNFNDATLELSCRRK